MTHYEVLQVMPTASSEVIRMAYKALASKYHPDVFQGNKEYAEAKMKQINEAYRVLSSPASRQEYDNHLQRVREQATQSAQASKAHRTYQAPHLQKKPSAKKSRDFSLVLVIAVFLVFCIGLMLLDDASSSTSDKDDNKPQAVQNSPVVPPLSGTILSGTECFDGSELTITADSKLSYVVKLKTPSGVVRLSFFVRAGETVTVGVPAEHLSVYFASGDIWYGPKLLFGDKTYYSKDKNVLDFTRYTWEYTLYPVNSGNFSETPIDPDEF